MPANAMSSKEVVFERLTPNNEEEYVDFLMSAYKDQFNAAKFIDRETVKRFWRWEYVDNPNAVKGAPFIWLCRLKGRIIAQACLMPAECKIGGKYFKSGWCQNFIILPEFRNMSLGYFLLKHMLSDLREDELDMLMVAGTNDNSYTLLKNIGFTDLGFIRRSIRPSLFGPAGRSGDKSDIRIMDAGDPGPDFDIFWQRVSQDYSCIMKRDARNLRWRYTNNPYWNYKILCATTGGIMRGYVVLKEASLKGRLRWLKVGVITDILFHPKDRPAGSVLFSSAISYLRRKTHLIKCDVLCSDMEDIIGSMGFVNVKSNSRLLVYPLCGELKSRSDGAVMKSASWYITYGDSDLDIF